MKATVLSDVQGVKWICFGRDPSRSQGVIDTNQFLVVGETDAVLIEPGGAQIFPSVLAAVLEYCPVEKITHVFASHQDPDVVSSLDLWGRTLTNARLYSPWLWEGFLRHYRMDGIRFVPIPDEGMTLTVDQRELRFFPAHYLHSPGNFHVWDTTARILMSGDLGAALEADDAPMFVDDFEEHARRMKLFHQRWLPSRRAKDDWIRRVRQLDVSLLAPQHGRLFRGADVGRFLDWLERLEVGVAV